MIDLDKAQRYLANPDASCREEQPGEGALLFNPDTDATMALNPVGLVIWQALDQPRTQEEIVTHLSTVCEGVPEDRVTADVNEFLETLLPGGFVGTVLENTTK